MYIITKKKIIPQYSALNKNIDIGNDNITIERIYHLYNFLTKMYVSKISPRVPSTHLQKLIWLNDEKTYKYITNIIL